MGKKDIEIAKRLKNSVWSIDFKEYYEPNDVVRYFEERRRYKIQTAACLFKSELTFIEPEEFFKKEVLIQGLAMIKSKQLSKLKNEIHYINAIKIPDLEREILRLEK